MIAPATLRRRALSGDTYSIIAPDLGITADASRKRARMLGTSLQMAIGRHRWRPFVKLTEQIRDAVGATLMAEGNAING